MSEDERAQQWQSLYEALGKALALFGIENPFGEADYWLVDDDYGDTTHKICVHRLPFLRPEVITAIQESLKQFPGWRVMVQLEIEIDGASDASSGFVIYPEKIESHWAREAQAFADLRKRLNL